MAHAETAKSNFQEIQLFTTRNVFLFRHAVIQPLSLPSYISCLMM